MIKATILADSKNEAGNRITTFLVTFPRIILAELNTHRAFSRNSASSRAIPFKKMVETIQKNPFIPIAWQRDHSGMQGIEYLDDRSGNILENYLFARNAAVQQATVLHNKEVTKQVVNRLLESYMWHTAIITATEFENFFALRCPQYQYTNKAINVFKSFRSWKDLVADTFNSGANRDVVDGFENYSTLERLKHNKGQAEIHMMALAEAMWDAYNESYPKLLPAGFWHIPYENEIKADNIDDMIKISTVMCARVSYTRIDVDLSEWSNERYIKKFYELKNAVPLHASPFEHNAESQGEKSIWSRNFLGFTQLRELIENN